MPSNVVPPRYSDAESDHPAVDRWCSTVRTGAAARLLLLGPSWSGKSHTAYAAIRRLVNAGYGAERIAVTNAFEVARAYDVPFRADVVMVDDVTISVDLRREAKGPRPLDPAEAQAALALQTAGLNEAVTQLVRRPNQSWILIGSTEERLVETLGKETTAEILAVADVADLPARPKPSWG
ncbi:hypothetical protein [Streptomyces lavendofoliae]|uniref:Uncharacterized protein n=1 Tax=Streptomyces lavendofoliae TaxID=67314 RepID=A0A918I2C1_9ACTN|nr:hypothetical protein [Streptomyces lavendofoliae]GGU61263.1 hypothetical protein GCM10010274_57650 [Streptomyces lavendofoliae]